MPNAAPCRKVSRLRAIRKATRKIQAIAGRQQQIGQPEIDRQSDQKTDQDGQEPMPARSIGKQLRRQITRERADHHGRRHRIARLGRIDHQVDARHSQRMPPASAMRVRARETSKYRKGEDRDVRQHIERNHLKSRSGNSASAKPGPRRNGITHLSAAGIRGGRGALRDHSSPRSRSPSACPGDSRSSSHARLVSMPPRPNLWNRCACRR